MLSALINQPVHFFSALFTIVVFLLALFSGNQNVKNVSHKLLYLGYALLLVSGCYLFCTLPFSIFVLIKSLGGLFLIVMAELIVRGKGTRLNWALVIGTAAVGLTIAYGCI